MKILFVCTGNTCRSPMAQFLLEDLLKKNQKSHIEVLSAGLSVYHPAPISENAYLALSYKNIDASSHRSRLFSPDLADQETLILTMSLEHKQAIWAHYPFLSNRTHALFEYVGEGKSITDPYGSSLASYQRCLAEIEALITKLYLQI